MDLDVAQVAAFACFSASAIACILKRTSLQLISPGEPEIRHRRSYGTKATRSRFSLDQSYHQLNHGSYGSLPRAVSAFRLGQLEKIERYPDRFFRQEAVHAYSRSCDSAGQLVHAGIGECVLLENATQAMDAVAASVSVGSGTSVLIFSTSYGSVKRCAASLCQKTKSTLVEVPVCFGEAEAHPSTFLKPLETALRAESDCGRSVSLAVLDHVTSPTAVVLPVLEMARMCKAYGVKRVAVDGAHAPGLLEVSSRALDAAGVDYWWGNLHKWCFVPRGVALLRAAPGAPRDELQNPTVCHFTNEPLQWQFFMCGTNDQSKFLCVDAAMRYAEMELGGFSKIAEYSKDLAQWGAWCLRRAFTDRASKSKCSAKVGAGADARSLAFAQLAPADMCVSMAVVETPLKMRYFLHPGRRAELTSRGAADADVVPRLAGSSGDTGSGSDESGSTWRDAPDVSVQLAVATDPMLAERIARVIQKRWKIQTVVYPLEGKLWCRLSAQVYNYPDQYRALAHAIVELCDECDAGGDPLTEILGESDWGFGRVDEVSGAMCGGMDGPDKRP